MSRRWHRMFGVVAAATLGLGMSVAAAGAPTAAATGGVTPLIIGGGQAQIGEYPFMAAILNEEISGDDWDRQFCGGSLISAQWVLTAAHCAEGASPNQLAVAVGRTVLRSTQGERRAVVEIRIHPNYGAPAGLSHDAALLRLASPVSLAPIRLATAADDPLEAAGTPLTVIGWGSTTASGQLIYPDHLMEVVVPAVSDATCAGAYGRSLDAATMLCAGEVGRDSCYGDSGGPLFAETAGGRVHLGIVSWGNGCAKKRFPGVYSETNSTGIRTWITQVAGV